MLTLESELLTQNEQSVLVTSETSFWTWRSWLRVNEACLKEDTDPGGGSGDGYVSGNRCGVETGVGIAMAMAGGMVQNL